MGSFRCFVSSGRSSGCLAELTSHLAVSKAFSSEFRVPLMWRHFFCSFSCHDARRRAKPRGSIGSCSKHLRCCLPMTWTHSCGCRCCGRCHLQCRRLHGTYGDQFSFALLLHPHIRLSLAAADACSCCLQGSNAAVQQ